MKDKSQKSNDKLVENEPGFVENTDLKHVLDEHTGELVEITDDMKNLAQYIESQIYGMALVTAVHLRTIRDFRLYLVSGFGNFGDYVNMKFNFSERMAQKYLKVADRFSSFLPETNPGSLKDGIKLDEKVKELSSLGISKLHELTRLPDADFSDVLTKRKVKLADGSILDLTEIEEKTKREVTEKISGIKRDFQRRISNLEEENKKHKSERDHYKKKLDENEDLIKRSREREAMHGPEARKIEDIEYNLERAEAHLTKLQIFFTNVEVDEKDPQMLRDRVLSILSSVTALPEMASRRMEWLKDLENYERQFFSPVKVKDPRLDPNSEEFDPDATLED